MKKTFFLGLFQILSLRAAILPPPWADPEKNPCASQPGGWLLVHWPPDEKCYRIFNRGYPCPETMELNPVRDESGRIRGECRCPPRTALYSSSDKCHLINTKGPCEKGEYFKAVSHLSGNRSRTGLCVKNKRCKSEEVFWPGTEECFPILTKGPCPEGQLIILNKETLLGECRCSSDEPFSKHYWHLTKTCHQYYTKGPCQEKGTLFLPGPVCGCHTLLPNYHSVTKRCYEIGTTGPCQTGHLFDLEPPKTKAGCICKPEHVTWEDGKCYRLYTKGPCSPGEILFPNKTCNSNPCPSGTLFFPGNESCHRVGVEGPCPKGQLVLFEQSVRPSVDGISFRGTCGCPGPEKCMETRTDSRFSGSSSIQAGEAEVRAADKTFKSVSPTPVKETNRKIKICDRKEKLTSGNCQALYSQGPCSPGEWLVPVRQARAERQLHRFGGSDPERDRLTLFDESRKLKVRCECRPGFTKTPKGSVRKPFVKSEQKARKNFDCHNSTQHNKH